MSFELPATHQALVLKSRDLDLQVQTVPTPQPDTGSVVVRVVAASLLPYHRDVYSGRRPLPFPTPLVVGYSAIARIAAIGADATALKLGQLVYVDCVVRARDNPSSVFLMSHYHGSTESSQKLMRDVWRDGTFAQYAKVPLENCIPLDEARLCSDIGYSPSELAYMAHLLVPFGGLRDIGLQAGETIIVCPATGFFSGFGVQVAAAMGARVIAMGRNKDKLASLQHDILKSLPEAEIETVLITGDEEGDAAALRSFGTIDAVLDISPSGASASTYTRSAIKALRHGGRVSVMGSCSNIAVPDIMTKSITVKGKMMYERADIVHLTKMLERRLFSKSHKLAETRVISLEEWKQGLEAAAEDSGIGKCVAFAP